jgi:hypothetical protein
MLKYLSTSLELRSVANSGKHQEIGPPSGCEARAKNLSSFLRELGSVGTAWILDGLPPTVVELGQGFFGEDVRSSDGSVSWFTGCLVFVNLRKTNSCTTPAKELSPSLIKPFERVNIPGLFVG